MDLNRLPTWFLNTFNASSLWDSQGLKARILKWFAIPFSSGPCFVTTLQHDLSNWMALHSMAHSFIGLDDIVIYGIVLVTNSLRIAEKRREAKGKG